MWALRRNANYANETGDLACEGITSYFSLDTKHSNSLQNVCKTAQRWCESVPFSDCNQYTITPMPKSDDTGFVLSHYWRFLNCIYLYRSPPAFTNFSHIKIFIFAKWFTCTVVCCKVLHVHCIHLISCSEYPCVSTFRSLVRFVSLFIGIIISYLNVHCSSTMKVHDLYFQMYFLFFIHNLLLAASKSQIFSEPDCDPAATSSSLALKRTHSTGVLCPARLCKNIHLK